MGRHLIFFVFFTLVTGFSNAETGAVRIHLLITSDLHGWLSTSLVYPREKRKGLLHLAAAIRTVKKQDPNVILLDAGDLIQGSPLVHYVHHFKKHPAANDPFFQLVQSLNYDAVAVGNHDLAANPLFEKDYLKVSNFSWLAANAYRQDNLIFKPYKVLTRNGIKIAILGFTTPGSMMWLSDSQLNGLFIESIKKSAKKWLQIVKAKENPDLIIGLFHVGINLFRDDENSKLNKIPNANSLRKVLQEVRGIDIAVSGHDHRLRPRKSGQKLEYIGGTPIISGGRWGEALIDVQLLLKRELNKLKILEKITTSVYPASQVKKIDRQYLQLISPDYKKYLSAELPWRFLPTTRTQAASCLNLLNAKAHDRSEITGTLLPKVRIRRLKDHFGKKIRRLDFFQWFPYDNKTITLEISQRDIFLLSNPPPEFGRFRVTYNRILYSWFKINIDNKYKENWWLDSKSFNRKYRVIMSDYHVAGGGGIIRQIFIRDNNIIKRSADYARDRLFIALQSSNITLPAPCSFLEYADAKNP